MSNSPDSSLPPDQQALLEAVNAVLLPLATLAVARGVHFSVIEERLRQAFVQAAREANPGGLPHRQVSRISTTTGINRREVTRLINGHLQQARPRRSLAGEVYAHWRSNVDYLDGQGQPMPLPRQGARPSFETLAREITSDVHPRSVLDDMLRLGYAETEDAGQRVHCRLDGAIPNKDMPRSLRILGDNVGAHLAASVTNVIAPVPRHFDRALVANGLPSGFAEDMRALLEGHWRVMREALVPLLEQAIAEAANSAAEATPQRVLIGLYSHHSEVTPEQE